MGACVDPLGSHLPVKPGHVSMVVVEHIRRGRHHGGRASQFAARNPENEQAQLVVPGARAHLLDAANDNLAGPTLSAFTLCVAPRLTRGYHHRLSAKPCHASPSPQRVRSHQACARSCSKSIFSRRRQGRVHARLNMIKKVAGATGRSIPTDVRANSPPDKQRWLQRQ